MHRFRTGMRVRVIEPFHPLEGRKGTVRELNVVGPGAAVSIEGGLPAGQSVIIEAREYGDVTILQPGQCEEVR